MSDTLTLAHGIYLPHSICDQWRCATDIGRWLEAQGIVVQSTYEGLTTAKATTKCGFRVFRNGYVSQLGMLIC